jgi:hypothetical protein
MGKTIYTGSYTRRLEKNLKKLAKKGKCLKGFLDIKSKREEILENNQLTPWEKEYLLKQMDRLILEFRKACPELNIDKSIKKVLRTFRYIIQNWKQIKSKGIYAEDLLNPLVKLPPEQKNLIKNLTEIIKKDLKIAEKYKGKSELEVALESIQEDEREKFITLYKENPSLFYLMLTITILDFLEEIYNAIVNDLPMPYDLSKEEIFNRIFDFALSYLTFLYKQNKKEFDKFIASI